MGCTTPSPLDFISGGSRATYSDRPTPRMLVGGVQVFLAGNGKTMRKTHPLLLCMSFTWLEDLGGQDESPHLERSCWS